jgi:tetratricopeptide (TPR) repeat protein
MAWSQVSLLHYLRPRAAGWALLLVALPGLALAAPAPPGPAPVDKPAAAPDHPAPPSGPASEAAREQARGLLRQGNEKLEQGLYLEALGLFERANALFPSPKLEFNIAQTLNELGRFVEALERYERFVRDVKASEAPDLYRVAQEQIFKLSGRVGRIEVQASQAGAVVTLDGLRIGDTPLGTPVRVVPGAHVVIVSKPEFEQQVIQTEVKPGETRTLRAELRLEAEAQAERQIAEQRRAERVAAEERAQKARLAAARDAERRRLRERRAGIGLVVAAAASLAAGAIMVGVNDAQNRTIESASADTPWTAVQSAYSLGNALRPAIGVALGVGAALGVAGTVLLVVSRPRRADVALGPAIAPSGAGVVATVRF